MVAVTANLIQVIILEQSIYATSAESVPHFNFAAVGDWHCNDNTADTLNNIIAKDPELVIGLGDYSYDTTADCWLQIVDPIDEKMKIAIGNHEVTPRRLLKEYMNHFNLTKQYYSFNYQNIHFVVMSTEAPFDTASTQYNFIRRDLSRAASNSSIDWTVVIAHKMFYSSPSEGLSKGYETPLSITYHPLFDKYGVDLVIQAHLHSYERTDPINYNIDSYSKPIITQSNTNNYSDPQGPIFITVGTGGAELHNFTGKSPYVVSQYTGFGFLNIDVTSNGTSMIAKFYANDGSTMDEFSVTRSVSNAEKD
jgi:calcineurin-like phosphoesterase family protein/iron/zinc purple acid phosphatase-like protein C